MLAQRLLDAVVATRTDRPAGRLLLRLLLAARRGLLRTRDPVVRYGVAGAPLELPLSHDLPLHRKRFPAYGSNVGRVAAALADKYADLAVVDVGANVGDTVALLRPAVRCPVLCVEAHPLFLALLERNIRRLGGDVEIERSFVSDRPGEAAACEPHRGTAHVLEIGGGTRMKTLSQVLADHPRFAHARLIKIDTDGLDTRIIRGEVELLRERRPVVLFEYDPHLFERYDADGFAVFEALRSAGYGCVLVFDHSGDFLLRAGLGDAALLEDVHHYYSGRRGACYADVCAFHEEDADVAAAVRASELVLANAR